MALIWTAGTTAEGCPFALQKRDGSAVPLSGATVTLHYKRTDGGNPSTYAQLTGTVSIDDAPNGLFTFQFSSADVTNPGRYWLYVKVDYGASGVYNTDATDFILSDT